MCLEINTEAMQERQKKRYAQTTHYNGHVVRLDLYKDHISKRQRQSFKSRDVQLSIMRKCNMVKVGGSKTATNNENSGNFKKFAEIGGNVHHRLIQDDGRPCI